MTLTFGYILQRSCWPSFVRICCTIKSMATWLSPPRGMITSAYFFDGRTKSSKAGFTNLAYCTINVKLLVYVIYNNITRSLKRLNLKSHIHTVLQGYNMNIIGIKIYIRIRLHSRSNLDKPVANPAILVQTTSPMVMFYMTLHT